MGLAVINGLAAEQAGSPGVNVAVLIDPQTTSSGAGEPAGEILPAARELARRGTFVRVHSERGAEVTEVTNTVELYPYDLLVFSTHCGDSDGYRWTYEFVDSEGIERTLVVDIALGIGRTEEEGDGRDVSVGALGTQPGVLRARTFIFRHQQTHFDPLALGYQAYENARPRAQVGLEGAKGPEEAIHRRHR